MAGGKPLAAIHPARRGGSRRSRPRGGRNRSRRNRRRLRRNSVGDSRARKRKHVSRTVRRTGIERLVACGCAEARGRERSQGVARGRRGRQWIHRVMSEPPHPSGRANRSRQRPFESHPTPSVETRDTQKDIVSTAESLRLPHADVLSVFPEESDLTEKGELTIAGCRVSQLAEEFGTPAYVIDEQGLRRQIRRFVDGLANRWPRSTVLFASKSLPAVAMYAIAESEGLGVDVAGGGELMMALAAGVDPARIYMHGNAKSDAEIEMALKAGIRCIIVDNFDDLARLESMTKRPQAVMIRWTPGISPQTHASQVTGGTDSKFGLPRDQVQVAVKRIATHPLLSLEGIHVHIGSQVLETEPFADAVKSVAGLGTFDAYDIGGGLGVQYTEDQPAPSVERYLDAVVDAARTHLPVGARLIIEPGRSLVARAGVTLYRVNTVKRTGKTFVALDGGMADNLDIALTGQRYHAAVATAMD